MKNNIDEFISPMKKFDTDKAWQKVFEQLNKEEKLILTKNTSFKKYLSLAASILIFIGISVSIYYIANNIHITKNYTYVTTSSEKIFIKLPDNSEVWLNKNSKLKYYKNFIKNRELFLDGEAYFLVKNMDNRPFKLIIKNGMIIVVGTSFYVTSKKETPIKIYVEEGKVIYKKDFKNPNAQDIIINSGYFFSTINKSYHLSNTFDLNFIAWKTGKIVFDYTPLYKVVEILENIFDCKINIDPVVANCMYTAKFNNQNINSIIKAIAETFDFIIFEKGNNKYFLKPKNAIICN